MSIVINGIGMPVDCTRCPCSDDETRFCRAANKYIPMLGKPKFCPLAEIITCKDCDGWDMDNVINNVAACAEWSDHENGMTRYTEKCDYCSYAERRTDDERDMPI